MSDAITAEEQHWRDSPLYTLIGEKFPAHYHKGKIDVRPLADDLGYSYEVVYRWFRTQRMTAQNANKLIECSKDRLKLKDLLPYVFAN